MILEKMEMQCDMLWFN